MSRQDEADDSHPPLGAVALLALVSLLLSALLATSGIAGVAAGNTPTPDPIEEKAPYYDDEGTPANDDRMVPDDGNGNATAPGILNLFSKVPTVVIGTGDQDPSASGFEGVLLTALVIAAASLVATYGAGVGPVGGSILGMVLAYGLTAIGLIPLWIQPLLLFAIVGVPASAAMLRVFRR